jgi:hypothetical protein
MNVRVAREAKGYQIVLCGWSLMAAERDVMDLQARQSTADLTSPTIALQNQTPNSRRDLDQAFFHAAS